MKVRAKETHYAGKDLFIIKDKIYEIPEEQFDGWHFFKSEMSNVHRIYSGNIKDYFEIIPDKPRICEILGVELNKPFNIEGWFNNPYILKESQYTKGYYYITNKDNYELSKADIMNLIEHSELIKEISNWTDEQKEIFKALKVLGYNYIARDSDYSIYAFEKKPITKTTNYWSSEDIISFNLETDKILNAPHLNFINWEDEEPFEIPEV